MDSFTSNQLLYEWLMFMVHVGKYTIHAMAMANEITHQTNVWVTTLSLPQGFPLAFVEFWQVDCFQVSAEAHDPHDHPWCFKDVFVGGARNIGTVSIWRFPKMVVPSLEKGSFVKNQTGNFSCVKVLVCVPLGTQQLWVFLLKMTNSGVFWGTTILGNTRLGMNYHELEHQCFFFFNCLALGGLFWGRTTRKRQVKQWNVVIVKPIDVWWCLLKIQGNFILNPYLGLVPSRSSSARRLLQGHPKTINVQHRHGHSPPSNIRHAQKTE